MRREVKESKDIEFIAKRTDWALETIKKNL